MSSGLRAVESKRRTIWRSAAALASAVAVAAAMAALAPAVSATGGNGGFGPGGNNGPGNGNNGPGNGNNGPGNGNNGPGNGNNGPGNGNNGPGNDNWGPGNGDHGPGKNDNKNKKYTLTLTKEWASGTAAGTAQLWVGDSDETVNSPSPASGEFTKGSSISFGELGMDGFEVPTWSCVAVSGQQPPPSGEGFKSPSGGAFAPMGGKNHEPEPWSRSGSGWSATVDGLPAADVDCVITNTRQPTVLITKVWNVNGVDVNPGAVGALGLSATLSVDKQGKHNKWSAIEGAAFGAQFAVPRGTKIRINESVTNEGTCIATGTHLVPTGEPQGDGFESFGGTWKNKSLFEGEINGSRAWTLTNEFTCDTLTVNKEWNIGGNTYYVPASEGAALPAGFGSQLEVGGVSAEWGAPVPVGYRWPSFAEVNITKPANCTVEVLFPESEEGGIESEPSFRKKPKSEHRTVMVVNNVTCTTSGGGGTPTPLTPDPEEPQAVQPEPEVTEPEVEGVSQEKPAKTVKPKPEKVEVKGESATTGAPSASAKTGESVSYGDATGLALAAGIIVLLGAARLRRRDEAA